MKKMLLITEGFYDYDIAIKEVFERKGHEVTLFQADITLRYAEKIRHRNNLQAYMNEKRQLGQQFLLKADDYDTVLVICGHSLHVETFLEFRKRQQNAEFILYLWDDIARVGTFEPLKEAFDRIYTFDWDDAKRYGLNFRPLFYLPQYRYAQQDKWRGSSCVGWLHSDRITVLNSILKEAFAEDDTVYVHLLTGMYTKCKYQLRQWIKHDRETSLHILTKKLNAQESAKILLESKTVIDIQHPTQRGLTIRTLESLAAHTKLITTNQQVKLYDFYDEDNVCVIDREHPQVSREWLERPWKEIEPAIVEEYSLECWAEDVLGRKEKSAFVV